MSFLDKAKNKAEELLGAAKETTGEATGNDELQQEGRTEQAQAGFKQTGEHVRDAGADVTDALGKALKRD